MSDIGPQPSKTPLSNFSKLCIAAGVACAAIAGPLVSRLESGGQQHLKAYPDIAHIWTVCDGDTIGVTRTTVETPEGCRERLDQRLASYASSVLRCVPALKDRPYQLAASLSLAYNIGTGGFCQSTAAKRFQAKDWRAGCDAFLAWNKARVNGQLVPVQGLTNRRREERTLCLQGL